MDDLISRQRILRIITGAYVKSKDIDSFYALLQTAFENILPSAQPDLLDDGTLLMTVPNGMLNNVKRVMVDEVGTKNCKVMYQDDPERGCDECVFKPFKQFQPERKKGHWIKISPANIYECSACGQNVMTNDIDAYRFCHGCSAEMRGEENGN